MSENCFRTIPKSSVPSKDTCPGCGRITLPSIAAFNERLYKEWKELSAAIRDPRLPQSVVDETGSIQDRDEYWYVPVHYVPVVTEK